MVQLLVLWNTIPVYLSRGVAPRRKIAEGAAPLLDLHRNAAYTNLLREFAWAVWRAAAVCFRASPKSELLRSSSACREWRQSDVLLVPINDRNR